MRPGYPGSLSAWESVQHSAKKASPRHVVIVVCAMLVLITYYHSSLSDVDHAHQRNQLLRRPGPWPNRTTPAEWESRADQVKQAFRHAYSGWETHAAPHDELKPVSNKSSDPFNGWGVTMYDSLDTMILMGLDDEFSRALTKVQGFNFTLAPIPVGSGKTPRVAFAPFFETVIRYLGGLLSAYALSHEPVLLERADDLGRLLSPAFDSPSGLPYFAVSTDTGRTSDNPWGVLAEIASCQLEYTYLGQATGKKEHYDRAAKIMTTLESTNITKYGMLPKQFDLMKGQPNGESLSVGAAADSAHEYLLKMYLLSAQSDQAALDLYMKTVDHILTHMLYLSPQRELLYVTDIYNAAHAPSPSQRFEHLSCFLPGLLALGSHTLSESAFIQHVASSDTSRHTSLAHYDLRELHLLAATGLAESCWLMYADQPSGLGPDEALMNGGGLWIDALDHWKVRSGRDMPPGVGEKKPEPVSGYDTRDYNVRNPNYYLRPETIESLYMMWRVTGDPKWRERGWTIFEALERETKTESGYASLSNVEKSPAEHRDEMPSYFLAETLKYLYLLFLEEDLVPLDKWVFNTEAHPLPVFSWSPYERSKFGIPKVVRK